MSVKLISLGWFSSYGKPESFLSQALPPVLFGGSKLDTASVILGRFQYTHVRQILVLVLRSLIHQCQKGRVHGASLRNGCLRCRRGGGRRCAGGLDTARLACRLRGNGEPRRRRCRCVAVLPAAREHQGPARQAKRRWCHCEPVLPAAREHQGPARQAKRSGVAASPSCRLCGSTKAQRGRRREGGVTASPSCRLRRSTKAQRSRRREDGVAASPSCRLCGSTKAQRGRRREGSVAAWPSCRLLGRGCRLLLRRLCPVL